MRSVLAVLILVAACGDDGVHHLADAPPSPDASHDASPDGPVTGPVSLTVTNAGAGLMGVPVYFQNADSSLVAMMMTDATGTATATMGAGGYVTALNPFAQVPTFLINNGDDLRTFAGVKPGDHLRLDQRGLSASLSFTVTVPVDANATEYRLFTSCSDGFVQSVFGSGSGFTPTFTVFVYGCATVDLAVLTFDINAAPSQALFHAGQAVTDGGQVDLTDPYVAPTTYTLAYANVPSAFTSLSVAHVLASPAGPMNRTNTGADVVNNAASLTLTQPPVTGASAVISTQLFPATSMGFQTVLDWGPQANPTTLDLASVLLPEYATAPTVDIPTHAVTWTSTGGAAQPDFAMANFEIDRSSTEQFWRWTIVAPYTSGALALPVLPADVADHNPVDGDTTFFSDLITAKVPGGYDAVRSKVLSLTGPEGVVAGASGRVLVESLQQNQVRRVNPWRHLLRTFGRR